MTSTLAHLLRQAADAYPDQACRLVVDRRTDVCRAVRPLHGPCPCPGGARARAGRPGGGQLAKDVALPIAIFGTLLAGGAYVPIDYLTPPARAHVIAADAEAVAVVSGLRTLRAMVLGDAYSTHDRPSDNSPALHWLGRGWFDPDRSPERQPVSESLSRMHQLGRLRSPVEVPASALAYILYTSGSTGGPKGVAHTNASALAFVRWAADAVGLRKNDVISQHASPSFDLSVFDFLGAAMAAARLALVPDWTFGRVAQPATSLSRLVSPFGTPCRRLCCAPAARSRFRSSKAAPSARSSSPVRKYRWDRCASCGITCRRPVESRTGMAQRRPTSAPSTI